MILHTGGVARRVDLSYQLQRSDDQGVLANDGSSAIVLHAMPSDLHISTRHGRTPNGPIDT